MEKKNVWENKKFAYKNLTAIIKWKNERAGKTRNLLIKT